MEMTAALAALLLAGAPSVTEQAETLASKAIAEAATRPDQCATDARAAVALTTEFEPTAFVNAGRKGEVVEDAYLAARAEYRHHRSRVYQAVGACLAASGRHDAAVRYFRRAFDLDPAGGSAVGLARSLVALGRGRPALDVLLAGAGLELSAETLALAASAADAAGLPSVQAELDRVRLSALPTDPKPEFRDGPLKLPERTQLSTGAPLQFEGDGLWMLYVADAACRSCSADLEALKRLAPASARVILVPAAPEQDQALRGVANLYRYNWPYAVGAGVPPALGVTGASVVVVGRRGFSVVVVRPPLAVTLPGVVEVLNRNDVQETAPRPQWNRRPVERRPPPPRPGLLESGFAPGEDEPAPPEFTRAVEAYAAGRPAEALRLFEGLEAKGDGWLLPPEARLDRALCLAALGRRDEARRLLLRTGDSRLQEDVDRSLEVVGSPSRPH